MRWVHELAVARDGHSLAATSYEETDRALWLWDADTGQALRRIELPSKPSCITFDPGGRRILVGNWHEGTVTVIDPEHGPVVDLAGNRGVVRAIAASPAGRVVSADSNGLHLLRDSNPVSSRQASREAAAALEALGPAAEAALARTDPELWPEARVEALRDMDDLDPQVLSAASRLARLEAFDLRFLSDRPLGQAYRSVLEPEVEVAEARSALRLIEYVQDYWDQDPHFIFDGLRGFALHRLGRHAEAIPLLERAAEDERSRTSALFPTGTLNLELFRVLAENSMGDTPGAVRRLEALLADEALDIANLPPEQSSLLQEARAAVAD